MNAILKLFVWGFTHNVRNNYHQQSVFAFLWIPIPMRRLKRIYFPGLQMDIKPLGLTDWLLKAFFYFANQTAAVLCDFPFRILVAVQEKSILAGAALVLQAVAMIMLGTKVSTFGVVMACVFCFVVYLFFVIIRKEKWNWIAPAASIMVILVSLVFNSQIPRGIPAGYP